MNEWPDPQFCVQDADQFVVSMNNELTGTLGPLSISGYTIGSRTITFDCVSTGELQVNDMIQFRDAGTDPALPGAPRGPAENQIFRVLGVRPDVSFSGKLEYTSGSPTRSAAVNGHFVQKGVKSSSTGSGDVTSNVKRGNPNTAVWISERSAHVSRLRGCRRVLIARKGTEDPETIYIQADESIVPTLANVSKAIGFAVVVISGEGASAQPFYDDGAGGPRALGPETSAPTRTWVSNVARIQSQPTRFQIGAQLNGRVGSTFILGEFTCRTSTAAPADGAFSTPMGQTVRVLASISPWAGARFTMPDNHDPQGFAIDMKQASGGAINEGVAWFDAQLEGQASKPFVNLAFSDSAAPPIIFSPIMTSIIASPGHAGDPNYYSHASGNFYLDGHARCWCYGSASAAWSYLSFDIGAFTLFAFP
jgi:hypothetical protein